MVVGDEPRNAGVVGLKHVGVRVESALVVAPEERDRPAQRLNVYTASAAGAVVDQELPSGGVQAVRPTSGTCQ